jgi:predicted nucleotidyltransferase
MNIDKIRKNYLSQEDTNARVQQVLRLVLECCQPMQVVLFGSAARGELTASSDIDMVVVVEDACFVKALQKQLCANSGGLLFPVDFLVTDRETYQKKSQIGGVYFDAAHEGIILFSHEKFGTST